MDNNRIRISIAEDEQLFAKGMASLLATESSFEVVYVASTAEELLESLAAGIIPDLILLDIHFGTDEYNMDGARVARKLTKEYPEVKILVLTKHDEPKYVKSLIRTGVKGYVLKKYTYEVLITAIKTLMGMDQYGRRLYFPDEIWQIFTGFEEEDALVLPKFTNREKEVINLVSQGKSNSQIAVIMNISDHGVEKHCTNIYLKAGVNNRVELATYAIKYNICEIDKK